MVSVSVLVCESHVKQHFCQILQKLPFLSQFVYYFGSSLGLHISKKNFNKYHT